MMTDVIVKDSEISGKGVFANKDFKKGEVVLKWDLSNQISEKEFEKMSEDAKKYISLIDGKIIVMQVPERYLNHSCDSNTFARGFADVAKRDIKKGEEITSDYKTCDFPGVKMKCGCGSPKCAGEVLL